MSTLKEICGKCQKEFSSKTNLRQHVRRFHKDELTLLCPLKYKNEKNYKYTCSYCRKNFNNTGHFYAHMKKLHGHIESIRTIKDVKKCPKCDFTDSKNEIIKHIEDKHQIKIRTEQISFATQEKFILWKEKLEFVNKCKFVLNYTKSLKHHKIKGYVCHRSGNFVSKGKGLRRLKTKGTCKINAYCPASIKIKLNEDGTNLVSFINSHIGHDQDIDYVNLTPSKRKLEISNNTYKRTFNETLDEIQDSVSQSNLYRSCILNKEDLQDIEKEFNLFFNLDKYLDDTISVETWIDKMKQNNNCILFYKPQFTNIAEHETLKCEDFLLIIMNDTQSEILKKYGSDCICINGTHGLNPCNFEIHTILVLDDTRESVPCAFLISNRTDREILKLFFFYIRKHTDILYPKIFISNMSDMYFNSWIDIMGAPNMRFFCSWHVDDSWRINLSKITTKEKRIAVYKNLCTIMQETDKEKFSVMIENFNKDLRQDEETIHFASYFKNNFMSNYDNWAYCFRHDLNTNMHLEKMHQIIKYICFDGKCIKRLDKAIYGIMRFVRNKLFHKTITTQEEKNYNKLNLIHLFHQKGLSLDRNLITAVNDGWEMVSPSMNNEKYFIQELHAGCACELSCNDCKICIHRYGCTCIDSTIKWNMCEHIHLLCMLKSEADITENPIYIEYIGQYLEISNEAHINEDDPTLGLTEICKNDSDEDSNTFLEEKERTRFKVNSIIDKLETFEELDNFNKILEPLSPMLAEVSSNSPNS